jgi:hypothetical protein
MGQWEAECNKHAPHLTVKRYHPSSENASMDRKSLLRWKYKQHLAEDLKKAEIIITSATFSFLNNLRSNFEFHSIVVDKSHLIGTASIQSAYASYTNGENRWCVTVTLFGNHEVGSQSHILGWWSSMSPHEEYW